MEPDSPVSSLFHIDRSASELEWNPFVRIPRAVLNVLTQVRREFEQIDNLALAIARENGLLHPIIAAYLDEEHCLEYLNGHNKRWGTNTQIDDLVSVTGEEGKYYCIVAAGGRRTAAIQYLETVGCIDCNEEYGPGGCYQRHIKDGLVVVNLKPNITFERGFKIQMRENTHMPVAPQREAEVMKAYFQSRKEEDPACTPKVIARELGRPEHFVRNALRYAEVPKQIQDAVDAKTLPYPAACEIARLNPFVEEGRISEFDQLNWAIKWGTEGYKTVGAFAKKISEEIFNLKGGQTNMIDLFFTDDAREAMVEAQHRAVLRSTVDDLSDVTEHLRKIGGLYKAEILKKGTSPYTEKQTVRAHRAAIRLIEPWLTHLSQLAGEMIGNGQEDKVREIAEDLVLAHRTDALLAMLEQGQSDISQESQASLFAVG